MVKEIERAGIPVVHMCNIVPVSLSVGANRIVPTISIPYPLGDPSTPEYVHMNLTDLRVKLAVEGLSKDVKEQTVFKP